MNAMDLERELLKECTLDELLKVRDSVNLILAIIPIPGVFYLKLLLQEVNAQIEEQIQ